MRSFRKYNKLFFICFYSITVLSVTINAQINDFDLLLEGQSHLKWNKRLYNALIREVVGFSLLECVEECLHTTRCKSINYKRSIQVCELNYKGQTPSGDAYIEEEIGVLYGDMIYWNKDIFKSLCNDIRCEPNEKCSRNSTHGWCEISDCGFDNLFAKEVKEENGIGIGYTRTFSCNDTGGIVSTSVCKPDGQWSELDCNNDLGTCRDGYIFEKKYGLCFKIYYEKKNWVDARTTCRNEDADLFIINTVERYTFIDALNLNTSVWIGGWYIKTEGPSQWVDGTNLSNDCFRIENTIENYLIIVLDNCDNMYNFMCEERLI